MRSAEIAEAVRMLRFHGSRDRATWEVIGYNRRLDEIQAAFLRVLLPHLDDWTRGRQAAAAHYEQSGLHELVTPPAPTLGLLGAKLATTPVNGTPSVALTGVPITSSSLMVTIVFATAPRLAPPVALLRARLTVCLSVMTPGSFGNGTAKVALVWPSTRVSVPDTGE